MSGWIGAWGTTATVTNLIVTGSEVISVNTSTNALRITQTGSGNALVVEDSANPDSTPFVVAADGNVSVGLVAGFAGVKLSLAGSGVDAGTWAVRYSNDGNAFDYRFIKTRNTSPYAYTIVQSNDVLGNINFLGDDGAAYRIGATISAAVDGTPGTNDMPGRLVFSTTADGASTPTERMRIDNAGRVGIGGTPSGGTLVGVARNITGGANSSGILVNGATQSDVTNAVNSFWSNISTQATAFTLSNVRHFYANQTTIGAGSAVTNQFGFFADSGLTTATNNYGFYSNIASGTGRYNFYAAGTANNYFAGNTGIGVSPEFANNKLTLAGSGSDASSFAIRYSNDTSGFEYRFVKSRSTNVYTYATVQSGDTLGGVNFFGDDGTAYRNAAAIIATVDGTPGTNDMPGRLVFSTTADGASSPTERMRIDNVGNIYGTSGTTSMTNGFFYIPAAGGAPSGVPTAVAGRVPMYYDTTNNNFYIYNGAWKKILLA